MRTLMKNTIRIFCIWARKISDRINSTYYHNKRLSSSDLKDHTCLALLYVHRCLWTVHISIFPENTFTIGTKHVTIYVTHYKVRVFGGYRKFRITKMLYLIFHQIVHSRKTMDYLHISDFYFIIIPLTWVTSLYGGQIWSSFMQLQQHYYFPIICSKC